jgi:predicted secreted protein
MAIPGTNSDFHLHNAAAALIEISAKLRSLTMSRSGDTVDITTLGDTSKEYQATLKDATFSLEGVWDATIDAILESALGSQTLKSWQYDPNGGGAGEVRYTGNCICTSYELNPSVDGVLTFSATLQNSGAVTRVIIGA